MIKLLQGVRYTPDKTILFFQNRQIVKTYSSSFYSLFSSPQNMVSISGHSPFFSSICLTSIPFTNKYFPKQGNPGITTPTQSHTQTDKKECEVIHLWSSLKGCDTIRCRKKMKTHTHTTLFSKWKSFLFAYAICRLVCLCAWVLHLTSLLGCFVVNKAFGRKTNMIQGGQGGVWST